MTITNCKTNHLVNPLGYELDGVAFSWTVEGAEGQFQTAARIIVRRDETVEADTGWGPLDSLAAPVELTLRPRARYTWTVAVRTDAGEEAASAENWFETGKLDEPWAGKWIGCDDAQPRHPVFSREIVPAKPVAAARLYLCGLGLYEAAWNGEKIGGEYLTPYCNDYNSWVQVQTYDITEQLQTAGVLSVILGNGWYKGRFGPDRQEKPYYGGSWKLIAEVQLTYTDGTEEVVGTDEDWTVTRSNITFSNLYDGEHRDDTLPPLPPERARLVEPPAGKLTARYSTPVAVREELPVQEIIHTPAGETVLDLGQNLAGSFRLRCCAPRGQAIRLQFGEILQNGNFYRDNLRTAKAEYVYVSDGLPHVLKPKFTYYGYRYVKVEGLPDLKPEDFTALALYSQMPRTGRLDTGNGLVNRLIANIEWGQKGNFIDVPTDCPQRDERMGWTGDAQVFAPTACYQRDSYAFYAKYLHDLALEQRANGGAVPNVIPSFGKRDCSAAWGDAACVIPWTLYQFYGDKSILARQFDSMKGWVEHIRAVDGENHGWRRQFHFGDWLALDIWDEDDKQGGTDMAFVADVMYLRCARLTAEAAKVLGFDGEAAEYGALAGTLLDAIRAEYFTPAGRCAVPTQTGLLLALEYGLTPDPTRTAAELARALKKSGGKLQTGFVGTPLLCPVLTAAGQGDAAFDLLLNEDYPGWLYAVKLGATTVWERWNSVGPDGKIAENGMNSLNHYAYGSIAEWLYADVAGLRPAAPGFRRAVLRPHVCAALGHAELEYQSAAGRWRCRWEVLPSGDIAYSCAVPFGCTAELTLPYGGGMYELGPGEFSHTYTPDRSLKGRFSTDTPLGELLANPRVKAALERAMPQIAQLPPSMGAMSMRQLAGRMGGRLPDGALDKIDAMLANL